MDSKSASSLAFSMTASFQFFSWPCILSALIVAACLLYLAILLGTDSPQHSHLCSTTGTRCQMESLPFSSSDHPDLDFLLLCEVCARRF